MGILRRLFAPRADSYQGAGSLAQFGQYGGAVGGRWVNPTSGLGGPHDRAQSDQYVAGVPITFGLADGLLETNGVARRLALREPEDCTREGYDITGVDPAAAKSIEAALDGSDGLDTLSSLCTARGWARAYGGAGIVMNIDDGRKMHEPLDWNGIRRLRGLLTVDRWELPVQQIGRNPKEAQTFGKPQIYNLQPADGGISQRVHADRVVRMRGMTLPRRLMVRRNWWDGSIYDLAWAEVRAYGVTHAQLVEALTLLNQGTITSEALDAAMETDEGPALVQSRLEADRAAMGLFGEKILGKGETYEIHNRSLAGVSDIVLAVVAALVVVSEMPRAVVLGEVPGGLGHGERSPELGIWYDHCASLQPRVYTPPLERILKVLLRSTEGPTAGMVPEGLEIEWRPLWQETPAERAERELKESQRRVNDVASTVVTTREVRAGDRSLQETYGLNVEQTAAPVEALPGDITDPEMEDLSVQEAALNGAQVKSLLEIVQLTQSGMLPRDSAIGLIGASFPLLRGQEERVLGSAGEAAGPIGVVGSEDDMAQPSEDPLPEDLISAKQAAAKFGVPTNAITRLIAKGPDNGGVRYWGLGAHKQVSMREVEKIASANQRPEPEDVPDIEAEG